MNNYIKLPDPEPENDEEFEQWKELRTLVINNDLQTIMSVKQIELQKLVNMEWGGMGTLLITACKNACDIKLIEYLLLNGANPNQLERFRRGTVSHYICDYDLNQLDLIELLAKFNANFNVLNDDHTTPLINVLYQKSLLEDYGINFSWNKFYRYDSIMINQVNKPTNDEKDLILEKTKLLLNHLVKFGASTLLIDDNGSNILLAALKIFENLEDASHEDNMRNRELLLFIRSLIHDALINRKIVENQLVLEVSTWQPCSSPLYDFNLEYDEEDDEDQYDNNNYKEKIFFDLKREKIDANIIDQNFEGLLKNVNKINHSESDDLITVVKILKAANIDDNIICKIVNYSISDINAFLLFDSADSTTKSNGFKA